MLLRHKRNWIPALKFAAPVLTILHSVSLLALLHKDLLQKLKVMLIFLLVMRDDPETIGGLDLRSLEITYGEKAIHHLVSSFTSCTPSKLVLISGIKYHQLEIEVESLFLSASCDMLSKIATST